MSELHHLPNEVLPLSDELSAYDGLEEVRFRRDGKLAVGLFVRSEDHRTVVAISARESKTPFIFPVQPEDANPAFEHPWGYAPKVGKLILQDILDKRQPQPAAA